MKESESPLPRPVLVIDPSEESRDVLRALLQRSGTPLVEADRADQGADLVAEHHPAVIVFDAECDSTPSREATSRLAQTAADHALPMIVLGTIPRRRRPDFDAQTISKPYHYGPLIRRIEQLLAG